MKHQVKRYLFAGCILAAYLLQNAEQFTLKMPLQEESQIGGEAKAGFPDAAMRWYYDQRAFPTGKIPDGWRQDALRHIQEFNVPAEKQSLLTWSALGPENIGGRIRSLAIHPTQSNIIYLASVSGGIWKTTNSGTSWTALKDNMENLAVCALCINPNNPSELYAGTGEGFF